LITGRNIFLVGCRNVLLDGVTILNPSGWSMWLLDCESVQVRGLKIEMDLRYPNGDGIHIGSCRDVTVSDCIVRSGDDALILRAYQHQLHGPVACERVVVANCVLQSNSAAVRIGWTHDYMIRMPISNLVIRDSHTGICVDMPDMKHVPNDPPRGEGVPPLPDTVHPSGSRMCISAYISMACRRAPIRVNSRRHKVSQSANDLFKHDDPLAGVSLIHAASWR
jgi:hypothetical protein